jgi:hypothetical protein
MAYYCPECDMMVEPYDGGEENDCAYELCPNCGYDFQDQAPEPTECELHGHTWVVAIEVDGYPILECSRCGLIDA